MGNEKPKKKPEEERTKINGKAVALRSPGVKNFRKRVSQRGR